MSVKAKAAGLLFVAALAAGMASAAWAKTAADLQRVEQELEAQKQKENALQSEEKQTSATINDLRRKLISASIALQKKQDESDALADKLDKLTEANKAKAEKLKQSKAHLAGLLSSLVELSREPPEALLLHTTLTTDQIHRGILLRELLPRVQETTATISADLADLDRLQTQLDQQKTLVAAAEQNLAWQKSNLDELIRVRQGSLKKTAAERAAMRKQLQSLASEAQDLRQLMQKVAITTALPRDMSRDSRTVRLNKGLRMPIAGRLVRPFGVRDASGVVSQGLTLVGLAGGPVVAPAAGKVVFAGTFRGYGQIVIISHLGSYYSFLAGFGRIDTELGQQVAAGEPLGLLPDAIARPEFYYEWRFRNDPIDPAS